MSDDLSRKQPEDPTKINIHQSWEVDYWSEKFGISEEKLKQAVSSVGIMVSDVRVWLSKN
jgi:hypothetical protein